MGPPPPWRIDPTTHRTMSERSYHGAKSRSYESESLKSMYLDAIESLICYRALMIAQTSAVNTVNESGNLMKITLSDGKTVAQATEFPSREPSV